jgi:hypothetical protein
MVVISADADPLELAKRILKVIDGHGASHVSIYTAAVLAHAVVEWSDMSSCELCKKGICSAHQPYRGQIEALEKKVARWKLAAENLTLVNQIERDTEVLALRKQVRELQEEVEKRCCQLDNKYRGSVYWTGPITPDIGHRDDCVINSAGGGKLCDCGVFARLKYTPEPLPTYGDMRDKVAQLRGILYDCSFMVQGFLEDGTMDSGEWWELQRDIKRVLEKTADAEPAKE